MFKRNKLLTLVASSALITCSAMSTAQETVTSTATVTVQNAFDLSEVAALSFGTLRATQDLDITGSSSGTVSTAAVYAVSSNGTANVVTPAVVSSPADVASALSELVAGTPGEYAIANAAPFTNLTINEPAPAGAAVELTNPSAPAASLFNVLIEYADMTVNGGGNDGDVVNATGNNLLTDASGSVGVLIGGRISINTTAAEMPDGDYTGIYTVTVEY